MTADQGQGRALVSWTSAARHRRPQDEVLLGQSARSSAGPTRRPSSRSRRANPSRGTSRRGMGSRSSWPSPPRSRAPDRRCASALRLRGAVAPSARSVATARPKKVDSCSPGTPGDASSGHKPRSFIDALPPRSPYRRRSACPVGTSSGEGLIRASQTSCVDADCRCPPFRCRPRCFPFSGRTGSRCSDKAGAEGGTRGCPRRAAARRRGRWQGQARPSGPRQPVAGRRGKEAWKELRLVRAAPARREQGEPPPHTHTEEACWGCYWCLPPLASERFVSSPRCTRGHRPPASGPRQAVGARGKGTVERATGLRLRPDVARHARRKALFCSRPDARSFRS